MAYAAGVDVGSTQTKAVIVDAHGAVVGRALIDTGANVVVAAENAYVQALADAHIQEEEVGYVVGTGSERAVRTNPPLTTGLGRGAWGCRRPPASALRGLCAEPS